MSRLSIGTITEINEIACENLMRLSVAMAQKVWNADADIVSIQLTQEGDHWVASMEVQGEGVTPQVEQAHQREPEDDDGEDFDWSTLKLHR